MVDQTAACLNANVVALIATVTDLASALCDYAHASKTPPSTRKLDSSAVIEGLSQLSITAGVTPDSTLKPDMPSTVRAKVAALNKPAHGAWYTVTVGSMPGVYSDIAEVQLFTSGVSGNAYKKYGSQEGALMAYDHAFNLNAVRRVA